MIFRLIFIISGLLLVMAAQAADVCKVKQKGASSLGEEVSFSGAILSDGIHRTLILPNNCPHTGFSMAPEKEYHSASTTIRQAVMRVGAPGTVDKKVNVDVDGTIVDLGNGVIGIKVTKLRRLTLVYQSLESY